MRAPGELGGALKLLLLARELVDDPFWPGHAVAHPASSVCSLTGWPTMASLASRDPGACGAKVTWASHSVDPCPNLWQDGLVTTKSPLLAPKTASLACEGGTSELRTG